MTDLVLMGMRGSGKSNVSRRLAVMTKRTVLSTDALLEYEAGRSIAGTVASHGWASFRDREFDVVAKVCRYTATLAHAPEGKPTGAIIDCGGGIVVDLDGSGAEVFSERKIELLRARGTVVWLRGDISRLAAKTAADASRPQLDVLRSLEEVMRRREPFYERAADVIVDIDGKSRAALAQEIHEHFAGRLWPERDFGGA